MSTTGIVKGNIIELDEPVELASGTRVEVSVTPVSATRKGSPQAVLQLAGSLTAEEGKLIRQATAEIRQMDENLWNKPLA